MHLAEESEISFYDNRTSQPHVLGTTSWCPLWRGVLLLQVKKNECSVCIGLGPFHSVRLGEVFVSGRLTVLANLMRPPQTGTVCVITQISHSPLWSFIL